VELLVVIGLIALLVAMLMPMLSRARQHAAAVKCMANLRSIGQALTMYTQQYRYYPSCDIFQDSQVYGIWPVRLRMFTGGEQGVFNCPARDDRFEWKKVPPEPGRSGRANGDHARFGYEVGEPLIPGDFAPFSYGYNATGTRGNPAPPPEEGHLGLGNFLYVRPIGGLVAKELSVNRVLLPADMIAITDGCDIGDTAVHPYRNNPRAWPGAVHMGKTNVLFCDGHVQRYVRDELLVNSENGPDPFEYPIRRMWNNNHKINTGAKD
jgi:prepilin-type processing-associated H-X9-DG protein